MVEREGPEVLRHRGCVGCRAVTAENEPTKDFETVHTILHGNVCRGLVTRTCRAECCPVASGPHIDLSQKLYQRRRDRAEYLLEAQNSGRSQFLDNHLYQDQD